MTTIKAPCIVNGCNEQAEFKKGTQKWVSKCPSCGSQFYQTPAAKTRLEKWLEKHTEKNETENSAESRENNDSSQDEKSSKKPRFALGFKFKNSAKSSAKEG